MLIKGHIPMRKFLSGFTGLAAAILLTPSVASAAQAYPFIQPSIAAMQGLGAACGLTVAGVWIPNVGHYVWKGASTATADGVNILQCTGVTTGRMIIDEGPLALASITAMQNLPGPVNNTTVDISGTQGGWFQFISGASVCTTDNGTKWPASDGTLGCWNRQFNGNVLHLSWWGLTQDTTPGSAIGTDNSTLLASFATAVNALASTEGSAIADIDGVRPASATTYGYNTGISFSGGVSIRNDGTYLDYFGSACGVTIAPGSATTGLTIALKEYTNSSSTCMLNISGASGGGLIDVNHSDLYGLSSLNTGSAITFSNDNLNVIVENSRLRGGIAQFVKDASPSGGYTNNIKFYHNVFQLDGSPAVSSELFSFVHGNHLVACGNDYEGIFTTATGTVWGIGNGTYTISDSNSYTDAQIGCFNDPSYVENTSSTYDFVKAGYGTYSASQYPRRINVTLMAPFSHNPTDAMVKLDHVNGYVLNFGMVDWASGNKYFSLSANDNGGSVNILNDTGTLIPGTFDNTASGTHATNTTYSNVDTISFTPTDASGQGLIFPTNSCHVSAAGKYYTIACDITLWPSATAGNALISIANSGLTFPSVGGWCNPIQISTATGVAWYFANASSPNVKPYTAAGGSIGNTTMAGNEAAFSCSIPSP